MKKNIIYIALAVIAGLIMGYFLFKGENKDTHNHNQEIAADQMWTCSMHPQIMKPEPGTCPLCGMDLIPATSADLGLGADQFRMSETAMELANVQTMIVGSGASQGDTTVSLSGTIVENEEATAIQASYFDGRIERLHVNYVGQEVRPGQLLATIYSPELIAAQQELLTARALKETQPQLYTAVRNKLKLWKLSEDQISAIETSGKVKENFPVYTTVTGTVSEVVKSEGNYVTQGEPILKLSDLRSVWAAFDVYESQISQFKVGQKLNITSNAYPGREFTAPISFIDPSLDPKTRTLVLRTTLKNKDGLFKPGMFVRGYMTGKTDKNKELLIPASAVLWTGERSVVYVKPNPQEAIFEMREVSLGATTAEMVVILEGLENGEEIVVNGTFTIDAAAQLQGKKSMMNKEGGQTSTGHEGHLQKGAPDNSMGSADKVQKKLPLEFQNEFNKLIPQYLELKNALVSSDASKASLRANQLLKSLPNLNSNPLSDADKNRLAKSKTALDEIKNTVDLEIQRQGFVKLNEYLINISKRLDQSDIKLFVQRCPMADNNKGAAWLSREEEIRNPYFGDKMMTCGEVTGIIAGK